MNTRSTTCLNAYKMQANQLTDEQFITIAYKKVIAEQRAMVEREEVASAHWVDYFILCLLIK